MQELLFIVFKRLQSKPGIVTNTDDLRKIAIKRRLDPLNFRLLLPGAGFWV